MTTFLLDLWQDLRAKRLWPVAAGLVVATLAVPALLFKPASSPPAATGAGQSGPASKLPTVALDASSIDNSHLDVFAQKNPFASSGDRLAATVAAATGTGTTTGGAGNPTASPTGSGPTATPTSSSSSGSSGGSSTGSSGTGGTSTGADGKPGSPGLRYFTYTADVRFGKRGHLKTYKSVNELDLLPDGNAPIVSFMGVKDGNTAMFFVADPAYSADGEGSCQPSAKSCTFVQLGVSDSTNEETLASADGNSEYTLKLLKINRVPLDQSKSNGASPKANGKARAKVARHERHAAETLSRFVQLSVFGGQG